MQSSKGLGRFNAERIQPSEEMEVTDFGGRISSDLGGTSVL